MCVLLLVDVIFQNCLSCSPHFSFQSECAVTGCSNCDSDVSKCEACDEGRLNEQKSACISGNDGGGSDDDDDDLSTGAIIGGCTIIDFCRAFNINSMSVYSCYLCNTEYIVSIKVVYFPNSCTIHTSKMVGLQTLDFLASSNLASQNPYFPFRPNVYTSPTFFAYNI